MDNSNQPNQSESLAPQQPQPTPPNPPIETPKQPVQGPTPPQTPLVNQPPVVAPQSTPSAFQRPPKKKRTGLIVGIILGSIALIASITAILLYFLWWQNPQKVVTDAVVGAITTRQAIVDGTMTFKNDDMELKMTMKSSTDAPQSQFDTTISLSSDTLGDIGDVSMKLAGAVDENGTIYLKTSGLKEIVHIALDAYFESLNTSVPDYSTPYRTPVNPYTTDSFKKEVSAIVDPIIAKIDNQWLKISASDFSDSKETKCMMDTLTEMQNDKTAMNEIGEAYREYPFLIIKDTKVPAKDGATGYEIDLMGDEFKQSVKDFGKKVKDSTYFKKISDCNDNTKNNDDWSSNSSDNSSSDAKATLRIWVDPLTHRLKHLEAVISADEHKLDIAYSFEIDKTGNIEIPSDARSAKEVFEEVQSDLQNLTGGGSYYPSSLPSSVTTLNGGLI